MCGGDHFLHFFISGKRFHIDQVRHSCTADLPVQFNIFIFVYRSGTALSGSTEGKQERDLPEGAPEIGKSLPCPVKPEDILIPVRPPFHDICGCLCDVFRRIQDFFLLVLIHLKNVIIIWFFLHVLKTGFPILHLHLLLQ